MKEGDFGVEIKKILLDAGLKQKDVAEEMEISRQSMSYLLNSSPFKGNVEKLVSALGYRLEFTLVKAHQIYCAILQPTFHTFEDGTLCEYDWNEKNRCEYGEEWNGDVLGYVENLIENENIDDLEHGKNCPFTIWNEPEGAVILARKDGTPYEMFWAE